MLSYHVEVVAKLSSLVRSILSLENFGPAKFYTPKNSQIFISLVEVNPVTLRIVMDSLYNRDVINFTSFNSVGIQTVIKMLGVGEELFTVSEVGPSDNNIDDSKIVDVISDLMEEFNADPKESEKALQDMLTNNLGDGFLTKIDESMSTTLGDDDFFGLENLMAEPGDEELSFVQATVEETMPSNIEGKLNSSYHNVANVSEVHKKYESDALKSITTKKCFVGMSNIPTETLEHYYNVRVDQDNSLKATKRRPEEDSGLIKRKRRKNLNEEFEYEGISEIVVAKSDSPTIDKVIEESSTAVIPVPNLARNPPPGPPIHATSSGADALDNTEVQFVEAKQVTCMICDEVFKVRSKIIQHLCVSHFSNQIFALYPFIKGGNCPLCMKAGKSKVIVLKDKNSHVRHIGQTHEIIFDIITPEFKESIDQFTKTAKRGPPPKYRVKEEKAEVSELLEESNSSIQESPEDNYLKLLKDFKENYGKPAENKSFDSFDTTLDETIENKFNLSGFVSDQPTPDKYDTEVIKSKPNETEAVVSCHLCPNQVIFTHRSQFLAHLSCQHSSREILSLYPFEEGKSCELCYEIGRPDFISTSPLQYADHLGTFHEKVLDLIPPEYRTKINTLPRLDESRSFKLDAFSFNPDLNSTFVEKEVEVIKDDPLQAGSDCDICHQTGTTSKAELMLHYASKHFHLQILKENPYQEGMPCKTCVETRQPKAFVPKSTFRHLKHVAVVHEKVLSYMSTAAKENMERMFLNKKKENTLNPEAFGASMKNLIISTTSISGLSCKICLKTFSTEEELRVHRISHKESKNYSCKYCGMTCETAKQYKVHLLSHKTELSKSKLA